MLQEAPPEAVLSLLAKHDLDDEPPLLTTSADLTLDGRFERQWLLVTPRHLAVIADGAAPHLVRALPLADVEAFRACGAVGSGLLQARVGGAWVDVVRYSNTLAPRFHKAAGRLEAFLAGGDLNPRPEDAADERRCAGCGLALAFAGDVCPRCIDRGAVLGRVWDLVRPYRAPAALMCLLVLLGVAAELAPPKLQQYLVDHVLQADAPDGRPPQLLAVLLLIVGTLAGTRLLLALVNVFKGALANRVGTAMTCDLRARLVDKLQRLSVDFYDRQPVGVLMSRVAHDTEALYGLVHQFTSGFLLQILQVAGVGVMLFTLNPWLAVWTLIPMPLVLYGSWFFWRYVYPRYYRYWDAAGKQAGALAGMLAGIRVVKAFAQEGREAERFRATSDALRHSRLGVEVSASTFSAAMQLVFSLGGLIVWFVGGRDVLAGRMTLGALMAFLAYLTMFYAPLTTLAQLTTWLTSFLTAGQRVFELLDTPVRVRDPERPAAAPPPRGHIRFDGVTFGYDRHRPVLKDFDLEVRPGEAVGVVGRSGSGKTTLVNLISRFYDVDAGRVVLDGRDVRDLAREDLRQHVGVVLQEPFLFRGTVWENLVYGRPGAEAEAALTASKGANAHDFIMRLPLAYDTPLGERGAGLSGGEKQRLSIARTLLYDPRVLILDEATSSVDTESEKAIQDALAVLTRGRTTIAIAHRLSTLRNADRILVLDHGRLIEEGTHEDLLARDGTYARLVRIQTQGAAASVDALAAAGEPPRPRAVAVADRPPPRALWEAWRTGAEAGWAEAPAFAPRWLRPADTRLLQGEHDTLRVEWGEEAHDGVFAVRALPATCPEEFLSLRWDDADGLEHEIGLVSHLAEWPAAARALLEGALARRYFLRRVTAVEAIGSAYGLLTFRVRTDRGPATFTMRNSHSCAQDYGPRGKLLIDVDDNRFLVADVDSLPRRQALLFRRYVYW
jgi:ATP-binding cassette subfamily B protein